MASFDSSTSGEVLNSSSAIPSSEGPEPSIIVKNLEDVKRRIKLSALERGRDPDSISLIAVSKTKPASDIEELYRAGQRDFGENYVEELIEKAAALPTDISWHFIGHLQSGKVKALIEKVPTLNCIETIDSEKLASKINGRLAALGRSPLDVYIQIDTSGEDTKSGVPVSEAVPLAQLIKETCPFLSIKGVMTIGGPGDLSCFDRLVEAREEISSCLSVSPDSLALSMGMSGDFEEAIARGATHVRVGSTIFGERDYSKA